jgi:anhydro-N-acetylmuramic acid kinase
MQNHVYRMIGLMSGTSGDGLDIAYCEFQKTDRWNFHLEACETVPFPERLLKKLKRAHLLSGLKLSLLDVRFGKWMGEQVKEFVERHQLNPDAVASHGHTVFHQPSKGLSLQIGNGWALHHASGFRTINDFRMGDILLGGQGAPLVPIGDRLLFNEFDYCINLGGIANISMEKEGPRIAFDICPFNLLLNHFAAACGKPYDKNGNLARSGKLLSTQFKNLNALPYYQRTGAKSLGREDLEPFLHILEMSEEHEPEHILHTLVAHFVYQIKAVMPKIENRATTVLVTGGGAFNTYFMERFKEELGSEFKLAEADEKLIGFKEALIFAFLGSLRLAGEVNCLATVTGASRDSMGGTVYGV